jgi:hypothetical protein
MLHVHMESPHARRSRESFILRPEAPRKIKPEDLDRRFPTNLVVLTEILQLIMNDSIISQVGRHCSWLYKTDGSKNIESKIQSYLGDIYDIVQRKVF